MTSEKNIPQIRFTTPYHFHLLINTSKAGCCIRVSIHLCFPWWVSIWRILSPYRLKRLSLDILQQIIILTLLCWGQLVVVWSENQSGHSSHAHVHNTRCYLVWYPWRRWPFHSVSFLSSSCLHSTSYKGLEEVKSARYSPPFHWAVPPLLLLTVRRAGRH